MSQRRTPKGSRRRAVAKTRSLSRQTRRGFLRASGAGVAGFALSNVSSARADNGDDTNLVITEPEDGTIWIDPAAPPNQPDPAPAAEDIPYDLNVGDVILCDPPQDEPVESFEIETTQGDTVVEYDSGSADPDDENLEVDLTILDSFEENYDTTTTDPPYTIDDGSGSIGING